MKLHRCDYDCSVNGDRAPHRAPDETEDYFVFQSDRFGNATLSRTSLTEDIYFQGDDAIEARNTLLYVSEISTFESGWQIRIKDNEPRAGVCWEYFGPNPE